MNKQRPIIILLLVLYIFLPSILRWVADSDGHWYRPFVVWLTVIAIAFIVQMRRRPQ